MAFEVETTSEKQPWIEPPAHRIGVDVMRLSLPDRFTFQSFVETVGDAVRTFQFHRHPSPFHLPSPGSVTPFRSHRVSPKLPESARNDWLFDSCGLLRVLIF